MIIDIDATELGAQLAAAYEAGDALAIAIVETLRPTLLDLIRAVNDVMRAYPYPRMMCKKLRRCQRQQAMQRVCRGATGAEYEAG